MKTCQWFVAHNTLCGKPAPVGFAYLVERKGEYRRFCLNHKDEAYEHGKANGWKKLPEDHYPAPPISPYYEAITS